MTAESLQSKFFQEVDCEELGLVHEEVVINKEKLRLKIKHPKITLKDIGLAKI